MSSWKNASKSRQRLHKERGQLSTRSHLGPLEKKKDYRERAKHFHRNQNTLKALKKKALEKNPDEFYFHMINSQIEDGVHYEKQKEEEFTDEQIKLMQTQDLKYINFKRSTEIKKIESLKACHHLLDVDSRPKNNHTFFVDTKQDAMKFDVISHLDTHPALIDRSFNRLKMDALKKNSIKCPIDKETLEKTAKERQREYKELSNRIEREKKLLVLSQKMEMKRNLMEIKGPPRERIKAGTVDSAPIYKWQRERKK